METQDVSLSEHARIDTIILLCLCVQNLAHYAVAFQEEYLCEMYKSFVVGAWKHVSFLNILKPQPPPPSWMWKVRIFMGTQKSALLSFFLLSIQ